MRKKIFLATLLITLSICGNQSVSAKEIEEYIKNYNGINMTTIEIDNLKSLGFTEAQIYYMEQEEFDKNKNLHGEVLSTSVKYVKTTYTYKQNNISTMNISEVLDAENYSNFVLNEEILKNLTLVNVKTENISEVEYNKINENTKTTYITNDVNPSIIDTEYKKLTTTIIKNSNKYRFKNDLVWKKMPSNRSYDVFGISINPAITVVSNSQYAKTSYTLKDSCTEAISSYSATHSSNWTKGAEGYAVTFQVPKNSSKTYTWSALQGTSYPCTDSKPFNQPSGSINATLALNSLSSYMYYDVAKVNTTTLSTLDAYGSYQHSVKNISLNVALSFSVGYKGDIGGVFEMTPTISSNFDNMDGTHAQLLNINW